MNDAPNVTAFPTRPAERDSQFTIMNLVGLMTAVAIACALVAPLLRAMQPEKQGTFLLLALLQFTILIGTVVFHSVRRAQLLKEAGSRLGLGYPGNIPGKHWPKLLSIAAIGFFGLLQITLAWGMLKTTLHPSHFPYHILINQMQLAFFGGMMLVRLKAGLHVGAVEFFEKGVALAGNTVTPWDRVEIRPSQLAPDRIVVVIRGIEKFSGGTTWTFQVDDTLRAELLKRGA